MDIPAASSEALFTVNVENYFDENCPQTLCFVRMYIQQAEKILHTAHNWPLYMKDQNITADLQPSLIWQVSHANYVDDPIFSSVKINLTNQATD